MSDEQWEETMSELRNRIPVNTELKARLRQSLMQERSRPRAYRWRAMGIAAIILCFVALSLVWRDNRMPSRVEAASLHFLQTYALIEQLGHENSSGMSEYDGKYYFPLKDRGLYEYDGKGFYKLAAGQIDFVRASPKGNELVYVMDGSLYLYHIQTNSSQLLLQRSTELEWIRTPSWSPDGTRILFVSAAKPADGPESGSAGDQNRTGQIMELNVKNGKQRKLADGAYPSYIPGRNEIIFELHERIIIRSLKDGSERAFDSGHYPTVSADGAYIAYVKSQGEPALEDVWVADYDLKTSKQISHNSLSDAWDRETGEMIEGKQQPRYTFEEPVWSSDGSQLFLYKVFHTNVVWKKLMQFKISDKQVEPEDIVAGSIQALIYRDEDYAHSFFSYDPGYLKGTSPRQVGYRILNSGQENGHMYVDAETYLSYYDPFYQIDTIRYWLSEGESGYLIDRMEEISDQVITVWGDAVTLELNDGARETIFHIRDIPKEENWMNGNVINIVYHTVGRALYFTMDRQSMGQSKLLLMKYDLDSRQFSELTVIGEGEHPSLMIIDQEQQYAAVEMRVNGKEDTVVYHLDSHKMNILSEEIAGEEAAEVHTRFWKDGRLTFFANVDDRDVFFQFDPASGQMIGEEK